VRKGSSGGGPIRQTSGRGVRESAVYAASAHLPVPFMRRDPVSRAFYAASDPPKGPPMRHGFGDFRGSPASEGRRSDPVTRVFSKCRQGSGRLSMGQESRKKPLKSAANLPDHCRRLTGSDPGMPLGLGGWRATCRPSIERRLDCFGGCKRQRTIALVR